jgi:hypothetical protein
VRRYEREPQGELIHIDIKKLGRFERTGHRITGDRTGQSNSRGIGWEYRLRQSLRDLKPAPKRTWRLPVPL